jgi:hypothetical protein
MKDHSFFLVARLPPFFLVNDIEDSYKRLYIQLKNLRGFGGMRLKIQTGPKVDWAEVMIEDNMYDKLLIFIS